MAHQLDQPPSMTCSAPVVNDDSSDARYSASNAISCGLPRRPIGWRAMKSVRTCSWDLPCLPACAVIRPVSDGDSTVPEIGRASGRERVCQYVEISGVGVFI